MKNTFHSCAFHKNTDSVLCLLALCLLLLFSGCGKSSEAEAMSGDAASVSSSFAEAAESEITQTPTPTPTPTPTEPPTPTPSPTPTETPTPTPTPEPTPEATPEPTPEPLPPRPTVQEPQMPAAYGSIAYSNDSGTVYLDASDTSNGYLMVSYNGYADKAQVHLQNPDGSVTPYPFFSGQTAALPLTCGNGYYQVTFYEHVGGGQYAVELSQGVSVTLYDEYRPYLYPNQYVNYSEYSSCVALARQLSAEAHDDLGFVQNVFHYVITHIAYDDYFAANTPSNYLPDPDRTLAQGSGVCFDYAALMTAMLRSQDVPTKLAVGYSGSAYHAWISVHVDGIGWVENIIEFNGKNWTLMDPTLAANSSADAVRAYIGDGSHYSTKYNY